MASATPFHRGESEVQERLGVRDQIEPWARQVIRRYLPEQHRAFYAQLPFLVVAARDRENRPWVSLLAGDPGFATSANNTTMSISSSLPHGDALEDQLAPGCDIGMLGIELATRRRNRVNGTVSQVAPNQLHIDVTQSFGNCPQHILPREVYRTPQPATAAEVIRTHQLNDSAIEIVQAADTLFIGSGHREQGESEAFGMDASHRGGPVGFVTVEGRNRLRIPDFAGNNHFNTLGNLLLNPAVGLLFIDFERGALLQITGRASIDWSPDTHGTDQATGTAIQRYIDIDVDEVFFNPAGCGLVWQTPSENEIPLRLVASNKETEEITSFYFGSANGTPLPTFLAGQHLPLKVPVGEGNASVLRSYSLSNAPGNAATDAQYRISVKRIDNGVVSTWLHDKLSVGDTLAALPPSGEFVMATSRRRKILAAAGVGVTPLLSMALALKALPKTCAVDLFLGARDPNAVPFSKELIEWTQSDPNFNLHVFYSQASVLPAHNAWQTYLRRLSIEDLITLSGSSDNDYYLCGPAGFMNMMRAGLTGSGVPESQIYTESFGVG